MELDKLRKKFNECGKMSLRDALSFIDMCGLTTMNEVNNGCAYLISGNEVFLSQINAKPIEAETPQDESENLGVAAKSGVFRRKYETQHRSLKICQEKDPNPLFKIFKKEKQPHPFENKNNRLKRTKRKKDKSKLA